MKRIKGYVRFPRQYKDYHKLLRSYELFGAGTLKDNRGKHDAHSQVSDDERLRVWGWILKGLPPTNMGLKRAKHKGVRRLSNVRGAYRAYLRQFPDSKLTERQFRRIYKTMPKDWFKPERQLREEDARGRKSITPYPNHTWSYDTTDLNR